MKKKKGLWIHGMPLDEQRKLEPFLRKKKYQVNLELSDGKKKFMYVDSPELATFVAKKFNAKILKITKIRKKFWCLFCGEDGPRWDSMDELLAHMTTTIHKDKAGNMIIFGKKK